MHKMSIRGKINKNKPDKILATIPNKVKYEYNFANNFFDNLTYNYKSCNIY